MFVVPSSILSLWFLGICSYALPLGGLYLLHEWYRRSWVFDPATDQRYFHPVLGWNGGTAALVAGAFLLICSLAGGLIVKALIRAFTRSEPSDQTLGTAFPEAAGEMRRLQRDDGSEIQVECYGPESGQPLVLTHGWGTNRTEWEYLRRDLSQNGYRLITWDLPGLGDSPEPSGKDYGLDNLALDLDLIVREICGNRPAVLAGHSIGGMITLTYCRLFPDALGTRVAGLILAHTTYTDPVHTAKGAALLTALERPVLVPLMYLTIALSPLLRLSNWLNYVNGLGHLNCYLSGFKGTQSWEELDFATRFILQQPPAVMARGMLGMMRYDATSALKKIRIPTLIICGDQDTSCRPEASERMAREIASSKLVPLSPANHMGLVEHHQTFASLVSDFLPTCFGESSISPVHALGQQR